MDFIKTLTILILISVFGSCQNKSPQDSKKNDTTKTAEMSSEKEILFVGTYTRKEGHVDGQAEGIYVYEFDKSAGKLSRLHTAPGIVNPSYLTVHPNHKWLYAASEIVGNDSIEGGLIYSYQIDQDDYSLHQLNAVPSEGGAPCYVSVFSDGNSVMAANYVGGNVSLFPINENGELSGASSVIQHEGSGPTDRQTAPHAHMITSHNDKVYAADLGIDKVLIYNVNDKALEKVGEVAVEGGSGPRHLTFHPNGEWAYVINELSGTVTAFKEGENQSLNEFQTISTLEEGKADAGSADIHITPDGKYLYASNRFEHNNIAMYAINQESGELTLIGHQSTKGKTPRNFVIDPSGKFLLVANQDSGNVVTFEIDYETGRLIDTGINTQIPTPVCLKFL